MKVDLVARTKELGGEDTGDYGEGHERISREATEFNCEETPRDCWEGNPETE